jgi:phosphoribosylformylglycinamidine synthase subunit PurQ / glutaminase
VATTTRIGVVTFPGSLDDRDAARAVKAAGAEPVQLWHGDATIHGVDAVVLPGGFSYGDYLRAGAIARFSPVVAAIVYAASQGLPVLGICNGFQVLCEAGLLPGALIRNAGLHFVCRDQRLLVESITTRWTSDYAGAAEVVIPVKHGEGRYVADAETIEALESEGRVVFRYLGGNPNGALNDIAGIRNAAGNVVGLMPHPEHAIDTLTGPTADGLTMFSSVLKALVAA